MVLAAALLAGALTRLTALLVFAVLAGTASCATGLAAEASALNKAATFFLTAPLAPALRGVATAGTTLRQMAQGAVAPGAAIHNAVNPVTTRRDMQSGMMTTARAANHWVAGNTMWNPAYRQNLRDNLGKNWGPASGGKVKKD